MSMAFTTWPFPLMLRRSMYKLNTRTYAFFHASNKQALTRMFFVCTGKNRKGMILDKMIGPSARNQYLKNGWMDEAMYSNYKLEKRRQLAIVKANEQAGINTDF